MIWLIRKLNTSESHSDFPETVRLGGVMVRKKWLVLSVVLVMAGLIVASFGNASREVTTSLGDTKQSELNVLSIGDNYTKGQKLVLGISPGREWYWYADTTDEFKVGGDYIELVPVNVTIIDPYEQSTKLEAEYRVVEGTQDLALFIVKVHHKSDGLSLKIFNNTWSVGNNTYTGEYLDEYLYGQCVIGGTVNVDGFYNVTVTLMGPPIPPTRLYLYKYRAEMVKDQWFLIPTGGVTVVAGCAVWVWAARTRPQKKHTGLKK